MKVHVALFTLLVCQSWIGHLGTAGSQADSKLSLLALAKSPRLSSKEAARSFLQPHSRQKRGWGSTIHGLTRGSENQEKLKEYVEDRKELVRIQTAIACGVKCWDTWQEWTSCSHKCNSGQRMRSREQNIPPECRSHGCPGSSSETQECVMKCGEGGALNGDSCSCFPGFHGECCQHKIQCTKPPKPEHGYLEGVQVWPTDYGSVVIHKCDQGYALIGGEQRTCQGLGTWTGARPRCERIQCPSVAAPTNGQLVNQKDQYLYGDQVGYDCSLGYYLNGVQSSRCVVNEEGRGEWDTPPPSCDQAVCGDPGIPRNAQRQGNSFTFDQVIKFTCNRGYSLIGSDERKCLPSGEWSGQQPECQIIRCPSINSPAYGRITTQRSDVDSLLLFACDRGYELIGNVALKCLLNGTWNGTAPTCEAISCGDPGKPQYGVRRDNGFNLGQSVTFSCFNGYILRGNPMITCLATRRWSGVKPRCRACPKDYYQTKTSTGSDTCRGCPRNSFTVTAASGSKDQCLCRQGFTRLANGTCKAIECPILEPPENGVLLPCNHTLGDECRIECADGYVAAYGSAVRMCRENGQWDGRVLKCVPCPINTYKASAGSCLPCPINSKTLHMASKKNDCICEIGFDGPNGGPCADFDECEINEGKGPCDQACENTQGSFKCRCNIPGYKVDDDGLSCFPDTTCKNLTQDDAPQNGGLVCHWYREENSQQCTLKCNAGFEFPTRINAFETCGPVTGYTWSFRRVNASAVLKPCIEEFFPDFRIEADSSYFVRACQNLTEEEKDEVKRHFAQVLTDEGVCWARQNKICDMRNVGIICGRARRKRGTEEEETEIADISFGVYAIKVEEKLIDCDKICRTIRIPARFCDTHCVRAYKRYLKAGVLHAKNHVESLFRNNKDRLTFLAAHRRFEASTAQVSDVIIDCEPGMVAEEGFCVPCQPGTMHSQETDECVPCPPGTFQPESKQTQCRPCPVGMAASGEGHSHCSYCPDGFYGESCLQQCQCGHGFCNVKTGICKCYTGWEGEFCDRDIDGCLEGGCFPGVSCTDVPAPGMGFQCGDCPPGLTGNGEECVRIRGMPRLLGEL